MKPSSFYSISTFSVFFFLLFYWFFPPLSVCAFFICCRCFLLFIFLIFSFCNGKFYRTVRVFYRFHLYFHHFGSTMIQCIISPGRVYHWYFHWATQKRCSRSIFTFSTALGRNFFPTGVQKRWSTKQKKNGQIETKVHTETLYKQALGSSQSDEEIHANLNMKIFSVWMIGTFQSPLIYLLMFLNVFEISVWDKEHLHVVQLLHKCSRIFFLHSTKIEPLFDQLTAVPLFM